MKNNFRMKKINTKEEVEFHYIKEINAIKTQLVVTSGTNLFQHWMQKNSKLNKTELTSLLTATDDEDELEILETFTLAFVKNEK